MWNGAPCDLKFAISSIDLFHLMRLEGCHFGSANALHGSFGNSVNVQPVKNQSLCSYTACTTAMPLNIMPSRRAFPHHRHRNHHRFLGSVGVEFEEVWHLCEIYPMLMFHGSNECLPICTSLPVSETNSYSLSHFRLYMLPHMRLTVWSRLLVARLESRTVVPSLLQRHRGQRQDMQQG